MHHSNHDSSRGEAASGRRLTRKASSRSATCPTYGDDNCADRDRLCRVDHFKIGVTVVDRGGHVLVSLRDDGAAHHVIELAAAQGLHRAHFPPERARILERIINNPRSAGLGHHERSTRLGRWSPDQDRRRDHRWRRRQRRAGRSERRGLRAGRHCKGCRPVEVKLRPGNQNTLNVMIVRVSWMPGSLDLFVDEMADVDAGST